MILQNIMKNESDQKDLIKIVDWNERRHREMAQQQLKENAVISLQNVDTLDIKIRVLTQFQTLNAVSNKVSKERSFSQSRATCVAMTQNLILIGNSEGQLWMFDRETEEEYASFSEKTKEFLGNSITALDVHPLRPEYAILGFERGQLVLVDVHEPKKSVKVIKDHHKLPIMNVKFCDWQGSFFSFMDDKKEDQHAEDKQAWMFISIDQQGRVIINSITKVLFVLKASKHIVIDPADFDGPIYASIACRFQSMTHVNQLFDDVPLAAIGNAEAVRIIEARPGKHHEFVMFKRTTEFYDKQTDSLKQFKPNVPSLSWGFGNSPSIQDRPHSILAIGWGPLIELIVLQDKEEFRNQPFQVDGYYILRNFNMNESPIPQSMPTSRYSRTSNARVTDFQTREEEKSPINDDTTKETDNQDFKNQQSQQDTVYDDSQAFSVPSLDIEQIQFFADSTLLVLTQTQEIRVLNVSAFYPDSYNPDKQKAKLLSLSKDEKKSKSKSADSLSQQVELEYGVNISLPLMKADYGVLYHQALKFFQGKIVALTTKNVQTCSHLTWQQSVYEFKKIVEDDLVQVFSRALDIYKGKVKGYAGLPDNPNQREVKLKNEIKLLVREIIQQVIIKTRQASITMKREQQQIAGQKGSTNEQQSSLLEQQLDLDFSDQRAIKYQTLIRIAIEFCVELRDQQFLFYDLFLLFQKEKLESAFIHELEPFIMAGKFQEWDLPNEVIQNHVLKYYRDPSKADALEKIIVNLNLTQCPKTIVLEFIHYSEQHFLTTAILYLYTQVYEKKDNTSCVQVLFSLFDLYKKAGKKNQGSLIDIQNLKEFTTDSDEKKNVEKSQIYLGYKILWVIRMFLNGLKFPQGTIRSTKWKIYIHDIVELIQTNDILKLLLEIDSEAFFQTIAILFYPGKPKTLLEQGRDLENEGEQQTQTPHVTFVKSLDQYCMSLLASDQVKYQYLFFAANVIAKYPIEGLDSSYFYNITRELLINHKRYLEYLNKLQQLLDQKNTQVNDKLNHYRKVKVTYHNQDEHKYLIKTENDFLNLMQKSEPLDNFQMTELLKYSEYTEFNQVKISLLEKKEEYMKCLHMLVNEFKTNALWTKEIQSEKVTKWIKEKVQLLEEKAKASKVDKTNFDQFKREVTQNIARILVMNPVETIHLIEDCFNGTHKDMLDILSREPQLQMLYLDTLLSEKEEMIEQTIRNYHLHSSVTSDAKVFIEFLKQHLRLCCQYQQTKVVSIVEKMVQKSYYPIEDCLQICQEYNQLEATFLLNRKVGKYFECIQQGLQILKLKVPLDKLKIELFFAHQSHSIPLDFPIDNQCLTYCTSFDQNFKQILNICKKHHKEVEDENLEQLWYIVVDTLYEFIKDPQVTDKLYCKQFFRERLQIFNDHLVRVVDFKHYMQYLLKKNRKLRFKEFGGTIKTMFSNHFSEKAVLKNAYWAIEKVNRELFQEYQSCSNRGILFRQRYCSICKRYMDAFLYHLDSPELADQNELIASGKLVTDEDDQIYNAENQEIKLFACKHTFHLDCLERHLKTKKKNESEEAYLKRIEKLRCPICNLKDFEIANRAASRLNRGLSSLRQTPKQQIKPTFPASSSANSPQSRKPSSTSQSDDSTLDKTELWERQRQKRLAKEQHDQRRKLEQLKKRMDFFESESTSDGLTIDDFKQVK